MSGSWVTWLIHTQFKGDVGRFMWALYRSGDYERATGKSYKALETRWRHFVNRRAVKN